MSLRWRLTLVNAVSLLLIGGLLAFGIVWALGVSVQDVVEQSTRSRANEAARLIEDGGGFVALAGSEADGVAVVAYDAGGAVLYREGHASPLDGYVGQVLFRTLVGQPTTIDSDIDTDSPLLDSDPRVRQGMDESYVYGVPVAGNDAGVAVLAASRSYDTVGGDRFGLLVVIGGPAVLLLMIGIVVASWFVARAALRPIETFTVAAEAIDSTDLGRRLPEPAGRRNEFTRLAHTFNRLLERLQAAFGDRERALEEQRRFTQDASHELRTPLTSILGYTRILCTWGRDNPEVTAESVAAIEREAQRMHELVGRLLSLARGDADAWLERGPTDLRDLTRLAVDAAVTADGDRHPIGLDVPEEPVIVLAEAELIRQALDILLENATRYTATGRPVEVTVARDGTSATVTVRDHGDGIAEADLPRLFERFYRGESGRDVPGTGLGLAIAHSIASRHGGTLTVASSPEGSVFTLTLPPEARNVGPPPG